MRSVLRVSSRVCLTDDEQCAFKAIGRAIPSAESEEVVHQMFDVLCGRAEVSELEGIVQFKDGASSISNAHWKTAESWCQWWTQERHLKMMSEATAAMCSTVWETTPFTTNAVESHNRLSVPSSKGRGNIVTQLEHQYRSDRLATQKHVAAEHDIIIHHRSDSQEAMVRRAMAKATWRTNLHKTSDRSGPPDTNLTEISDQSGKRPIPHQQENSRKKKKTDLLGRLVSVECMGEDKVSLGWYDARIECYQKGLGYLLRFLVDQNEYIYAKKIPAKDIKLL
jgi:hypothetical protein